MKTNILILIGLFLLHSPAIAQNLTNINAGLIPLHWSDVGWADYDNDGDLDILIAGYDNSSTPVTRLYKNTGNDTFSEVFALNFPGTYIGDFAWGDYDADGDLDFLIQGYTVSSQITRIYRNIGNDGFVDSGIAFPGLADGSVSFADYDNDGYLDLLIAGFTGSETIAILYKNNGDNSYTDSGISLPGAIKSSYEWADYDNDGDLDIFISGLDNEGLLFSNLYENIDGVTFEVTANIFTGAWLGDAAWGDFDNDGDPDMLLSGFAMPNNRIVELYKNNGDGTFTLLTSTGLTGVSHSSTIWGDCDNDGDLDIFIGGTYDVSGGWIRVTDLFMNNGDETFSAAGLNFSDPVFWGESAWGDYDADGDLDIICCGHNDTSSNTIIYRNDITTPNIRPESPQDLTAQIMGDDVLLSWEAATDNETPSAGLTYNVHLQNESGDIIWNSMSRPDDGQRLLPALGNAQQSTNWQIKGLAGGSYFWKVQALDNNFAGSLFSNQESFIISSAAIDDRENSNQAVVLTNSPNPFRNSTSISFHLSEGGYVQLDIFNINGQLVNSLMNQKISAGHHSFDWGGVTSSGNQANAGLYYYRLTVNDQVHAARKCLLLD